MRTLHRYLTGQVIASLVMAALVFTFVMMLGNVLKDVLGLVVSGAVSAGAVLKAFGLLIPFVWVFALPGALLTATLLVFGRFSADHELTAARASGISLVSLAAPILWLSLLLCGLCAAVNLEFAPRCWAAFKDLRSLSRVKNVTALFPEGRCITDFPNYILYIGKVRGNEVEDVKVWRLENETNLTMTVLAPRGRIIDDRANNRAVLELFSLRSVALTADEPVIVVADRMPFEFSLDPKAAESRKRSVGEMTFLELRQELRDLEQRLNLPATAGASEAGREKRKEELDRQREELTAPIRVRMHEQVALSFACFGFALIGIPLGIRVHRRETNVGFAVAIALVILYYGLLMAGKSLAANPHFSPQVIMWLPNFLFQIVGTVLLWRANRGI